MKWLQWFFRFLGLVTLVGALYAFYDFGKELLPIFESFVAWSFNSFALFTVLTSFFLGVPSLLFVGIRLMMLRSFKSGWFYFAVLPLTVWLMDLFAFRQIADMDEIMSKSVTYGIIYFVLLGLFVFIHARWFMPVSHEKMGHVRLENPDRVRFPFLKTGGLIALFVGLIVLHHADIATTLEMLFSPIKYLIDYLQSLT